MASQMKNTAPASIQKLVETFEKNLGEYRSSKNETELRREFLDKFFTALGWDVDNLQGAREAEKEVAHEFSVEIDGQQKKADYAFRIKRDSAIAEKFDFLVEAKKPSVKIETDLDAAFQIRRYGWSARIPINILTDFEHFAIYDCRVKPKYGEKAVLNRQMLFHYKEYIEKWDEIVSLFSPEAIRAGSLSEYVKSIKGKRGTADVDDDFLQEIERWRELLAKNIASNNEWIDISGLNYAVQMIIDRIIFLRICEERSIEPENQLQDITNKENIYKELCSLFKRADTKYNSGLFHFAKESGEASRADDLTLRLDIDDKTLKDIILNLYYPKSPYAFLYIPSDILGQVYERFLGKVIRLTDGHRAKVEEKPEVRKAGGVFYTPTFIVTYIVINTLGKLLIGLTPKEAVKLKIVDPACGSGTFLLGAFEYLLAWHLKWYSENDPEKWVKNKVIVKVGNDYRLTTSKKKEILLNNIYGVDIDAQAVEVTKLSLLLKVLENASGQLELGMERILPDLGNNIKCGNSLVGEDYFSEFPEMISQEERNRINPFNWESAFPEVFAQGGFDVVVGNPPWGAEFTQGEKEYFRKIYDEFHVRTPESFNYFVAKMWMLTKKKGLVGVIIPSSFLNQHEFWKTRKSLVETSVFSRVCNLGDGVFTGVTAPSCILVFGKETKQESPLFFDFRKNDRDDLPILLEKEDDGLDATSIGKDSEGFILQIRSGGNIVQKCYQYPPLRDIAEEVATGVSSGLDTAYVYLPDEIKKLKLETGLLRKLIVGGEIGRYWLRPESGKHIIYITSDVSLEKYPNTQSALLPYREQLKKRREAANGKIPWFALNWPRRKKLFEQPKILIRQTAPQIMACLDNDDWYCLKSGIIVQLPESAEIGYYYLLGLLNSRLIKFLYDDLVGEQARVFPEVKPVQLFKLPIRTIRFNDSAEKSAHDKIVSLVESMLTFHKSFASAQNPIEKERLEKQIKSTDERIDKLVYELYGLSDEEIKIVEEK